MHSLAIRIAHLLYNNSRVDFYEDEIRYGIEIVLGGLLQIIITMMVAVILKIGLPVMAIIFSSVLYRKQSGGAHCQAYYRCTIAGTIHFILLGYISLIIPTSYLSVYLIGLILFVSLVIHYYVPVDNYTYRINDPIIIKQKKQRSYGVLIAVLLASVVAYILNQKLVAIALLLGLFWQNITLLPWGQAYIHLWDWLFEKMELIFVKEEVKRC